MLRRVDKALVIYIVLRFRAHKCPSSSQVTNSNLRGCPVRWILDFLRVVARTKRELHAKMPKKLPAETYTHDIFHVRDRKPKIISKKTDLYTRHMKRFFVYFTFYLLINKCSATPYLLNVVSIHLYTCQSHLCAISVTFWKTSMKLLTQSFFLFKSNLMNVSSI